MKENGYYEFTVYAIKIVLGNDKKCFSIDLR